MSTFGFVCWCFNIRCRFKRLLYLFLFRTNHCFYSVPQNPDGSLSQAAMMQSALAKERRELKQSVRAAELDSIPTGLHKNWVDPMPDCKQCTCNDSENTLSVRSTSISGPHI